MTEDQKLTLEAIDRRLHKAEYTDEEIKAMTPFDKFDAYLKWEGIIGYSNSIWEAAIALSQPQE
jgi:hypothetical protein